MDGWHCGGEAASDGVVILSIGLEIPIQGADSDKKEYTLGL